MKNPEFFEKLTPMEHNDYIKAWREEEDKSHHESDSWMHDRIRELDDYGRDNKLSYFLVVLTQIGFNNIVLKENSPVQGRINKIMNEFDEYSASPGGLAESTYTLGHVRRPRELVVMSNPNHHNDEGREKLYAVNLHRLLIFRAWVESHGFEPVKVYYCEEPGKF